MKKIMFASMIVILAHSYCYAEGESPLPEVRVTLSDELLALASSIVSGIENAVAPVAQQAEAGVVSTITAEVGTLAHHFLGHDKPSSPAIGNFVKPVVITPGVNSPLCTVTFNAPDQSAVVRLTLACSEGGFQKTLFLVAGNPLHCRDVAILDGAVGGPNLSLAYTAIGNALTINGLVNGSLSNSMLFVEIMPDSGSAIVAFS